MTTTNCTRTLKRKMFSIRERISRSRRTLALCLAMGLTASVASKLDAQSTDAQSPGASGPYEPRFVQVAGEPTLPTSSAPARSLPFRTTSQLQEPASLETNPTVEPKRLPQAPNSDVSANDKSSPKRQQNYLPPQRPIGQVNIDVRPKPKGESNVVPDDLAQGALGEVPVVLAASSDEMLDDSLFVRRRNRDELFAYQPLYFEEVNLERYGRSCGPLQPAISGVRFFGTVASMPYAMAVHHPNQAYTFRWPYEAGWGAPKVKELGPLKAKPALVQAGVVTGLFFVVP